MFFDRLIGDHTAATPGPAGILGLEHEFNVFRDGQLVDFRILLQRLLEGIDGDSWHDDGRNGAFLDDGNLICCDGTHAETALAPEPLSPGAFQRLSDNAAAHQETLKKWIGALPGAYALQGYSTHLSAYCRFVDPDALAARYAQTYAPAIMLMIDRSSSPGLLVRPRLRRFEIGGDYLGPGPFLERAACVFVATTLACIQDLLCGDKPVMLDTSRLELPTQRPGWFVARDAFGADLYTEGRSASLRLKDGGQITAQDLLQGAWQRSRKFVESFALEPFLQKIDAVVAGEKRLPLECTEGQTIGGCAQRKPGELAGLFGRAVRPMQLGEFRLTPHRVSWESVLFRVEGPRRFFANIPRRQLGVLNDLEALEEALASFEGGIVDVTPETATLSDAVDETKFGEPFSPTDDKKKKKKKTPELAECSVTVKEESELGPVVEICIPETRDSLIARKPQEPLINATSIADGVMGHNGGWMRDDIDLSVRGLGYSFSFRRWYRSFVDHDGIMGHRWDHEYNQRIIPSRPEVFRNIEGGWCETYTGPDTSQSGDIRFCDGSGRVTAHQFESWNHRTVRHCISGNLQTFKAVVTIYSRNPGERAVIQRYAVYSGRSPWIDPVFYIRRSHDGRQQVFNCHGYLIALIDAPQNVMRFDYGLPFNPGTRYLTLARITDTSGRTYSLSYGTRGGALRLLELVENRSGGRSIRFNYDADGQLVSVERPGGQFPINRVNYEYSGAVGRMVRYVAPEQDGGGQALVEVTYTPNEEVETQREGAGTHRFAYANGSVIQHTDRRGIRTRYNFIQLNGTAVAAETAIQSEPLIVPANITFNQPAEWLERRSYDNEFQITRYESPRGLVVDTVFEPGSAPITEGDTRDWVERDLTWTTDLARGNKIAEVMTSPRLREAPRKFRWRYERLFNQLIEEETPLGQSTFKYENGFCARSFNNARPIRIVRPQSGSGAALADVVEECIWGPGGLLVRRKDPDNIVTEFSYEGSGGCTRQTIDPGNLNIQQSWRYDDIGRPVEEIDADGGRTQISYDARDNVDTIIDELGHEIRHKYDRNDTLLRVEQDLVDDPAAFAFPSAQPAVYAIVSEFDIEGRETRRISDADGLALTTEWDYDAEGNVVIERSARATGASPDDANAIEKLDYDARNLLYRRVQAPGTPDEVIEYQFFDEDGNLLSAINGEREQKTWVHNFYGEQLQERDGVGGVIQHFRNGAGQVIRYIQRGTVGGPSPNDRAGLGNRVLVDVLLEPDAYDRLLSVSPAVFDPISGRGRFAPRLQSSTVFTPGGRRFEETDPAGRKTVYGYDSAGRLTRTEMPGGHQRLYTYSPMGRMTTMTQLDVVEGRPLAGVVAPLRLVSRQSYDRAGRIVSRTLPGAGTMDYAYNSLSWPRAEKRATGAVIVSEFDTAGRRIAKETPAQGGAFNPDAKIRLTWTYDASDNLKTSADGLGNVTTWTYDAVDRLRISASADGTSVRADLDRAHRPVLVTYRGGEQIQMTYDDAGRLVRKQHINAAQSPALDQVFEVDGQSRVTRMTDNSDGGTTVTRSYNSLSWLVSEDQDGFRTVAGYDLSGRLTNLRYPSGRTVAWGLYPSGRAAFVNRDQVRVADYVWRGDTVVERQVAASLSQPSTGIRYPFPLIRRRNYDASGRLTSFQHVLRDAVVTPSSPQLIGLYSFGGLSYDRAGRLVSKQRAGNVETYTYDLADQLTEREVRPTAQPGLRALNEMNFYDAAGNAKRRDRLEIPTRGRAPLVSTFQDFSPVNSTTSRRIAVNGRSGPSETISYFQRGGLFTLRHSLRADTPGADSLPSIRRTFFDALGRHRLCFIQPDDARNSNLRIFNRHDASDRRLVRIEQDVTGPANTVLAERQTRYIYWGDRVLEEYERDSDTATWQRARTFLHGAENGEIVTIETPETTPLVDIDGDGRIGGDATLVMLQDHDNSPLALCRFNAVGNVYSPVYERYYTDGLGKTERFRADGRRLIAIVESTIGHVIGHHGHWTHSKEGLAYVQHRYRDVGLGIWISPEPAGDWASPGARGNGYPYAGNNPVMATDPDGEELVTLAVLAALAVGTYLLAEYTESEFVAAFSPIHDAATAITGYNAVSGREVPNWERGLSAVGAILSFIPIFSAAKAGLTAGRIATKAAAQQSAKMAARAAIAEEVKIIGKYGGSKAALQRIDDITREAIRLAESQFGTYKHGLSTGLLRKSNKLLNVKKAQDIGAGVFGRTVPGAWGSEFVELNAQVIARFNRKPQWFAKHIMGHEAQHVVFSLKPGRLQFLRRLTLSETPVVRAIPRWIDEGIAYSVSHGGRFRPRLAFRSIPAEDKLILYAIGGNGVASGALVTTVAIRKMIKPD